MYTKAVCGLRQKASIITGAALIMVAVFGGMASGELVTFQRVGFVLAVAIFLDATLIRVILVPALMQLMGEWNWWLPAPLAKILPKVELEREAAPSSAG